MTRENFINEIAPCIVKYAQQYNVLCPSAVIAQAVIESDGGNSELATNANNYFGLKYRTDRCPTACGIYYKDGFEQNADGSYTTSAMQWMKFSNMEDGVKGYFDFTNIANYSKCKGISTPQTYLENIKAAGYATSINYVPNLMNVISSYKLTQYDNLSSIKNEENNTIIGGTKMTINVHAGHNPDGKTACGAVGLIKESTEARKVKDEVIRLLKLEGHTVYDCTVEDGTNQSNVLTKIVNKCNSNEVDLDVSIHFNAGANDKSGNGTTTGTEVLVYNSSSKAMDEAERICKKISALGFKNRGIKTRSDLYVLKKTKAPALLVECCFVDDADDAAKYDYATMAKAIVEGILDKTVSSSTTTTNTANSSATTSNGEFKIKVTDSALNIRSGAGTNYKIVGCIKDKGTYTITKTSGSWGYLKSGAGWISISTKYVKYV